MLVATLRISLTKKLPRRLNLLNGSRLYYKTITCEKKILPFVQSYKVTAPLHHPNSNLMSKWHLIQPLKREIYKKPTLIYYILVRSKKSLVMYHTLQSLCVCVWLVNTLISTAPIGSPIICMWSPADICEHWESNLCFGSADVCGAAWEATAYRLDS